MALSAYDDPRNTYAYDQMRQQEMQRRYELEQMNRMQNMYARGSGVGETLAQAAPKQEEPNKALLLLPPVA